jgi:thioredoxin reductase
MAQQVLLAVDTDREILTAMERDFSRRFGADYPLLERKPSAGHSGDLLLTLADGSLARSDTVVIATGVTYRRLDVPGSRSCSVPGCSTAPPSPRRLR